MPDWESFYRRFREPDFVPGYEIQNRLGGGAFGEVFKARKLSIGKAYAIKFLKLDEASQNEAVERELEQVRLFAAIDHPHLVTIEDMGMVMDVPFLIMGYAGEETLARRLSRGDLSHEEALRFFVQTCRGVLALHDRRLAHFDLKPSNVFLKGDVARVGDYGLAKLLSEGQRTLSFGRGTPHYMAPEMLRNRADQRADIYSLGVILYESLTGKVPFGQTESGFGIVVREDDQPPEFPAGFPPRLRWVTERCLRLDPKDRYRDVHELLAEMGQSARQGDSVLLDGLTDNGNAGPPVQPRVSVPAGAADNGGVAREPGADAAHAREPGAGVPADEPGNPLRTAAAELARGAVGVARGMWDGVVTSSTRKTKDKRADGGEETASGEVASGADSPPMPAMFAGVPPDSAGGGAPADGAGGGDVVSVQTLDDPDPDAPGDPPSGGARAGMLSILDRVRRERVTGEREPDPEPPTPLPFESAISAEWERREAQAAERARPSGSPSAVRAARGTVPVPPKNEGGVLAGAVSTLVLGLEVMVSLVSGPILFAARALGRAADGVVRRVPGMLGSVARFGFFLAFFFLFGAVVAFAILLSLGQW